MPDTLEQAPAEPTSDRAGFRLAAFAAVIVVVLFGTPFRLCVSTFPCGPYVMSTMVDGVP